MKVQSMHNNNSRNIDRPEEVGRFTPDLMTEAELIEYLRIPEVSQAQNPHHVIENLKRMHDLPRIRLCNRNLYPLKAVREWIDKQIIDK